ncbi:MAG TPA: NarK family nitrate/nitrite MFS transporter [Pseudomonadales bacterium]
MSAEKFNLLSFTGKMKILHMSWFVFFITFIVWFNAAPLMQAIAASLGVSPQDLVVLATVNVAIAVPSRVIIGMLTDKYGPRIMYSVLLILGSIPCFWFATVDTLAEAALARFFCGFIGAGFVIGIRLVSEWFPANELGTAEGIYGGWGNFGSSAAAFSLPVIALWFGGEDGWRYAIALTGAICFAGGVLFYFNVRDTPKGSTYFKPKSMGAMEVTSVGDLVMLYVMKLPMYLCLAVLAWRLSPTGFDLISAAVTNTIYAALLVVMAIDFHKVWQTNRNLFSAPVPELHRYKFKQVAILNVMYFCNFGSELAVVSVLPLFFAETFELSPIMAGIVASTHAFLNLVSRPGGGWISDKVGRKKSLLVLTLGLSLTYFVTSQIDSSWSLLGAVVLVMACAFFVQAGEGAVFATVPLIKRRLTGQIAGMTGAYGNVGAVVYLLILTFVDYSTFFMVIGVAAFVGFIALLFMDEPKGHIAEVNEDGTVELIHVG